MSRVWPYMHQLRIMPWVNSWVARLLCLLPYVPLYRLRRHQENYCDCALVHPEEHLSRESRKLTGMMRRELVAVREVLKSLKIFSALGEETASSDLGVYSAPIRLSEF